MFVKMSTLCIVLVVLSLTSFVSPRESENTQFEAAFQGRCGHENPCEQLCYELHDGMFECDCKDGFVLHTNGYSCLTINSTSEAVVKVLSNVDERPDVIYQKDVSFSAVLDTYQDGSENNVNNSEAVRFIVNTSLRPISNQIIMPANTSSSYYSSTTERLHKSDPVCSKSCGAGTCLVDTSEVDDPAIVNQRCQCVLGKTGVNCQADIEIRIPRFSGQGWLAFPALHSAYKHVQLEMEFRPESWNGILFLTGERDDLAGDFVAVILHEGFIEFRFDCGSGVGVIRSDETVLLNRWNKLTIYRHRWDAWIQLNKGKHIQGRSKGLFSRITFREPVFIGGRGNTTVLADKIPTDAGFKGCVRYLEVNGVLYNFAVAPLGDAISGFDVEECVADRCSNVPCKHGGKCITNDDSATCLCPLGFIGDLCETRLDLQVPLFNGSSFLKYHGLGYNSLSWLDVEIVLKPIASDGLILYNGHKIDGMGDFIAVYIFSGYLIFTFDLGTGSATIRSIYPVVLNEWHTLRISRTGRYAVLQVDSQPSAHIMTPGAYTQLSLSLNLYVGGVPNFDVISPKIKTKSSFVGCIQKIIINERPLHILAEALAGLNIDNCPHPCLAKPCDLQNELRCEPLYDSYKCVCEHNCRRVLSNEVLNFGNIVTFNEDSFLHYIDPEVKKRITSDNISINLRFKTTSIMGLILWYGNMNSNSDFLSLELINGYLHLTYDEGNGEVSISCNITRVDDGHWHRVNIFKDIYSGNLMVDNSNAIINRSTGPRRQINANSGLYIGGIERTSATTQNKMYTKGIKGCISDFVLNSDYHVKLSWKHENSALCEYVEFLDRDLALLSTGNTSSYWDDEACLDG